MQRVRVGPEFAQGKIAHWWLTPAVGLYFAEAVDPPVLAQGDGPIPAYRKYCRQFYPDLRAQDVVAHTHTGSSGVHATAEEH